MYSIILNPISGNGHSLELINEIKCVLDSENVAYCIYRTEYERHATQLAREAVGRNDDGIIAVGGDGTLFEIVNGIAQSSLHLIFVACGTGNDFIKMLGLPKDPIEALKIQLHSSPSQIDLGRMNDRYFLNVAGTGFDVDVLNECNKYKDRYKGLSVYFRGLLDALHNYAPVKAELSFDGAPSSSLSFAIFSIGNGRYIGGGMKAVPNALISDGQFDTILVKPVRKFMIPILIVFFILGLHVKIGLGKQVRCKRVRLMNKGMVLNLDGELLQCDDAEFELLPHALTVHIPTVR